MQLSPLQSRLAASLAASIFLLVVYWILFPPNFAFAAELPQQPDSRPVLDIDIDVDGSIDSGSQFQPSYEPDFGLFDRSIIGRQDVEPRTIEVDKPTTWTPNPGDVTCYVLSKDDIFKKRSLDERTRGIDHEDVEGSHNESDGGVLRKRDDKVVYASAATCMQPSGKTSSARKKGAPQLKMLAAVSKDGKCPTSSDKLEDYMWTDFDEGLGELNVTVPEGNSLYISIVTPEQSDDYDGSYNFEFAVSLKQAFYHYDTMSSESNNLVWMDSDNSAALLLSRNLTLPDDDDDDVKKMDPPFDLYVENEEWPVFTGIKRSMCGMEAVSLITANMKGDGRSHGLVNTSMTTRGQGELPKQEFYFQGLNETSSYTAVLVQVRSFDDGDPSTNSKRQEDTSTGSRYVVSDPIDFRTLSGTTCRVITDLDFCSETQYAVPGNNKFKENTALAKKYDDYAKEMYSNFEKIMMQIPCETWPESQYSLARNCDDCKDAYKRWLCTVAIPRCEDYFSPNKYALERRVGQPFANGSLVPASQRDSLMNTRAHNNSRNAFIDKEIQPGPYKEVLPCEEVCYEVVQSCPAAIGFTCPRKSVGFEYSYGKREEHSGDAMSCNYLGLPRTKLNGAETALPPMSLLALAGLAVMFAVL